MTNRTYDLFVLIDADAPSDTRAKIVGGTTALINQHGDIKQTKDWGLRDTPYRIEHHEAATYHVFQFESDPDSIEKLDRSLKLTEGLLRFRLFQTEPGELPDSPPAFKREERAYERPPANVASTDNISEETPQVVGNAGGASAAGEAPAEVGGEAPQDVPAESSEGDAGDETPSEVPAEESSAGAETSSADDGAGEAPSGE